jgi:hypothetical protein
MEEFKIKLTPCQLATILAAIANNTELATEIVTQVKEQLSAPPRIMDIDYVQKIVCEYFSLTTGDLHMSTRKRDIVQARQIAMYYSKLLTKSSLATIGLQIGGKDHATVLHACGTISNLYDTDKELRFKVDEIGNRLDPYNYKKPAPIEPVKKLKFSRPKKQITTFDKPALKQVRVMFPSTNYMLDKYENQPTFAIPGIH